MLDDGFHAFALRGPLRGRGDRPAIGTDERIGQSRLDGQIAKRWKTGWCLGRQARL
jgi:hypothetical protein